MSKTVLVIDDEEAIRKSFTLSLEATECKVETAESGEKGLEKIRNTEYDLIYLDLKMPGIDGVETLREIRKIDKRVSVYLVTAFHEEFLARLEGAVANGIDFEVLRKPIGSDQIISITKSILNQPTGDS